MSRDTVDTHDRRGCWPRLWGPMSWTSVLVEGRSAAEVARAHGTSRYWLYTLIARYRDGGYAALEPRSRRPRSRAHAVPPVIQAAIVRLRGDLAAAGHDCGPHTIAHHLRLELGTAPSVATIWRIHARHGQITAQPHYRPRSSFIRLEASLPNALWQADSTPWLARRRQRRPRSSTASTTTPGSSSSPMPTSPSRPPMSSKAFPPPREIHGFPAAFLTDNGAVISGKSR